MAELGPLLRASASEAAEPCPMPGKTRPPVRDALGRRLSACRCRQGKADQYGASRFANFLAGRFWRLWPFCESKTRSGVMLERVFDWCFFRLVAGAGFEPATFRL